MREIPDLLSDSGLAFCKTSCLLTNAPEVDVPEKARPLRLLGEGVRARARAPGLFPALQPSLKQGRPVAARLVLEPNGVGCFHLLALPSALNHNLGPASVESDPTLAGCGPSSVELGRLRSILPSASAHSRRLWAA